MNQELWIQMGLVYLVNNLQDLLCARHLARHNDSVCHYEVTLFTLRLTAQ